LDEGTFTVTPDGVVEVGFLTYEQLKKIINDLSALNPPLYGIKNFQTAGQAIMEHLTAQQMDRPVVTAFEVARADFMIIPKIGRWRCPVCNHWVDEKAGWRITPEEEICGECYRILKGGEPEKQGDSEWLPR
jgi:hypothetical protein